MQVIKRRNNTELNKALTNSVVDYGSFYDELSSKMTNWGLTEWVVMNDWDDSGRKKDNSFPLNLNFVEEIRTENDKEYIHWYRSNRWTAPWNCLVTVCFDANQWEVPVDDFWMDFRVSIRTNYGTYCTIQQREHETHKEKLGTLYNDATFILAKGAGMEFECQLVHFGGTTDTKSPEAADSFFGKDNSIYSDFRIFH